MEESDFLIEEAFAYLEGNNREKDIRKAVELFEKLALDGDVTGQFCLARFYWNGEFVEQDDQKAIYWYEKAAENGNAFAQYWLGNNYINGTKSKVDYERAFFWYEKAAKQDMVMAKYNLGLCFLYGMGTEKSIENAIACMEETVNSNLLIAELLLAELYKQTKSEKDKKYALYIENLERKYETKMYTDETIALAFANAYKSGEGLRLDYNKAFELYNLKLLDHNVTAMLERANCYEHGIGVEKNVDKAIELYGQLSTNSSKALRKYTYLKKKSKDEVNDTV